MSDSEDSLLETEYANVVPSMDESEEELSLRASCSNNISDMRMTWWG
jgi:hypothetical protein